MDQFVIYLSINHATLSHFRNILSSLHMGSMSTHMGASRSPTCKGRSSAAQAGQNHLNESKVDRPSWKILCNRSTERSASISEQPLWSQEQQQGIELSTITYSGKGEAEQRNAEQSEEIRGVRVRTEVIILSEHRQHVT